MKALIASGTSLAKETRDSQVTSFVVVFEVNERPGAKSLLPSSIETNLPHIQPFYACLPTIHVLHIVTLVIWAIIYETLPAVIKYGLSFLTKEGHRTILKMALGKFISVNMIIDMPMIKSMMLLNNVSWIQSLFLPCTGPPLSSVQTSPKQL